ncbi:hypothetical protein RCIP0032_00153 [Klebsiella phage RCIP0032]|jgi:hypothetical protein|uniref:Uncharacterized protein n=1 Tax=Klebsiella phage Phi_KR1 TaxID=3240396 RepID=A0AB39U140_9CAUD|nr:hypothetical protein KMI13_138 [Klebsiella phage KMI13]QYC52736.1 hypothetical protein [Klebsiella phage vB_KpnM_TU02]UGO47409.1 hypothetical protein LILPANDA_161 [Klebsiella phage vB_KaeM_LilPanda]UYL05942.1 hypothetical protein MMDGKJEO_00110 [Klebsiella phage KP13MC5-5]WNO28923.1 hypothetical protein vBKpnMJEC_0036 [Klebsiella phage vB_KpnM-JEC]CAD5241969.1 hypothetical protein DIMCIIMF_00118 [Klebsiella phage vB_KpM-Wobble]
MLVQVKFKRVRKDAGFTLNTATGTMAVKVADNQYRVLGSTEGCKLIDKNSLVWADTFQVKRWYEW